jgi:GNAT superfamily N-acetyltransferase
LSAAAAGVRPASHRDLDRVTELWIALGGHHAAREPAFALRASADTLARRMLGARLGDPDTAILVHEDAGALTGLLIVRVDRAPEIQVERCRGEITDLYVREPARRRGIGRALAEAGAAWARERGAARIEVRVAAANPAANAFWRASGFAPFVDVLHRHL